jgi:hypothetical protein
MPLLGPLVSMSAKVALENIASKNPIEAPTPDFLCLYSTSMVDLMRYPVRTLHSDNCQHYAEAGIDGSKCRQLVRDEAIITHAHF